MKAPSVPLRSLAGLALALALGCTSERRPVAPAAAQVSASRASLNAFACVHDPCGTGGKLAEGCDPCVSQVCAQDPFCCTNKWNQQCVDEVGTICGQTCGGGGCAHDRCASGVALDGACDGCVAQVCAQDSYCCSTQWDSQCVSEVGSVCGLSCSGPPPDLGVPPDLTGPAPDLTGPEPDLTSAPPDLTSAPPDLTSSGSDDGTPMRLQCTSTFGKSLQVTYGRLDGYLVAIVPPAYKGCSGDKNHVHLQILVSSSIYDVAVNVNDASGGANVQFLTVDLPLPDGAWSEGWHTGIGLDYPSLGVHSGDFTPESPATLAADVENQLAQANHVSIFGTAYNSSGTHLIHRKGSNHDGAIVTNPLSANAHLLLFHFVNQSF